MPTETKRDPPAAVATDSPPEVRAVTAATKKVGHRRLMKKVERLVESIGRADSTVDTVHDAMDQIVGNFRHELGIYGGRLYERADSAYVLRETFGDAKPVTPGFEIDRDYAPVAECLEDGVVFMRAGDERADPSFEGELGVDEFAAVSIGDERFILALDLLPGSHEGDILFSLGIIRHALDQKLHRERMADILREVRAIQESILPRRMPDFPPYDIAAGIVQMESGVGGDLYDLIPVTDRILGVAIADATGHGLPAALQVRDIYTGLRMGLARDFKIVRTVERLNMIIHESTLTSRFVSLFYGELEANGNFIYVNAGHPPPIYLPAEGRARLLEEGGAVLGPLPDATYERGFVQLRPGDMIVAFTDGITEAEKEGVSGRDTELGFQRLLDVVRRHQGESAQTVFDAIAQSLEKWTGGSASKDDRTLVVIVYPPQPGGERGRPSRS